MRRVQDEFKEAILHEYLAFEHEHGGKPYLTLAELRATVDGAPAVRCTSPRSRGTRSK
jgi:hypothetical protein